MLGSFLIILREGLEAAIIIGILLAYIYQIKKVSLSKYVYIGTGFGVLGSLLAAYLFQTFAGGFQGQSEEIFEGIAMLIAVIILTTMIIWVHRQSKNIKGEIQGKIDNAVENKQVWSIALLAFISVLREGIEVVLFFSASSSTSSVSDTIIGGLLGLLAAIILAVLILKSSRKLNIGTFFKYSGLLIILISSGLLAHGIHELQEAFVLPIIIEHIWDMNGFINEKAGLGLFLKAIFGYNGNPSLIETIFYFLYLGTALKLFLKKK